MSVAPMVSIMMLAYKHGPYIEMAIESIVNQNTSFSIQVVVGEDCSPDNTRDIINNLVEKYPLAIKPILHGNNVGAWNNQEAVFNACTGKYIAFCEGDDFWNTQDKLQKQVDILEANPEVGLVFSNFNIKEKHRTVSSIVKNDPGYSVQPEEILVANSIATCTVVCRRELLNEARAFLGEKRFAMGDYPLWLYIAQKSKIAYIDEPLATYRIVGGSATNQGYQKQLAFLESQQEVKSYFMERFTYSASIQRRVRLEYLQKKLMLCFLTNRRSELKRCSDELKTLKGRLTLREKIYAIAGKSSILSFPLKGYHDFYHWFRMS